VTTSKEARQLAREGISKVCAITLAGSEALRAGKMDVSINAVSTCWWMMASGGSFVQWVAAQAVVYARI
jgi:hypothetical protein